MHMLYTKWVTGFGKQVGKENCTSLTSPFMSNWRYNSATLSTFIQSIVGQTWHSSHLFGPTQGHILGPLFIKYWDNLMIPEFYFLNIFNSAHDAATLLTLMSRPTNTMASWTDTYSFLQRFIPHLKCIPTHEDFSARHGQTFFNLSVNQM